MCVGCAMAAMAGANGARTWLHTRHSTWLTPKRMKVATIGVFTTATLASSVAFSGSSAPPAAQPHHALAANHAGAR
jgi:hypothetical protein